MRFVKFFKTLANWLFTQNDINYNHVQNILRILFKNMTESERIKYEFWHFKCLSSIHKQLTIPEFIKGSVKNG